MHRPASMPGACGFTLIAFRWFGGRRRCSYLRGPGRGFHGTSFAVRHSTYAADASLSGSSLELPESVEPAARHSR